MTPAAPEHLDVGEEQSIVYPAALVILAKPDVHELSWSVENAVTAGVAVEVYFVLLWRSYCVSRGGEES